MAGIVKGETLIGKWTVPVQGTLRGLPPYALPEDAVYDSLNVLVRAGAVEARPGLTVVNPSTLGGRPIGAFATTLLAQGAFQSDSFQNDAFQISGNTPTSALIVVTPSKIWAYWSGVYHDITDTTLTGTDSAFARMTSIQISNTIYILISNGIDVPRVWDSVAPTVAQVSGTPPKWTDVTTASDRIIGIIPPYTIQWGNSLDLTTWPALNFRTLSDTIDPVVAIRNLGSLGVAVYKTRSIWIGQPGGTTDASYFSFVIRGFWDGPASPYALIDADGAHYYMTDTGRIGYFDGTQQQWIADGVWPAVQAELDQPNAARIFGVFDPSNREINFYYPRVGDGGACKGIVTLRLPRPAEAIPSPIAFRGLSSIAVSVGCDTRLDTRKALVLGDTTQIAYTVEGDNDAGTNFSGYFQPGFISAPALDMHRLEGYEVFVERGQGYGQLLTKIVSNNLLENPATNLSAPSEAVDLSLAPPTQQMGGDVTGKFLGLRFEFTTPIRLRWYAARLAARRIEPDQTSPFAQVRGLKVAA